MEFMEIGQKHLLLPGMNVDQKNPGKRCVWFWDVGVVDNLSPIDIYSVFLNLSFQSNDGFTELTIISGIEWNG